MVNEISNEELIEQFETKLPAAFHHADHVRLAFAYLAVHPVLQGLEGFSNALKAYATACGKGDRYHETITHAYFFLIHERMARTATAMATKTNDWDKFASENSDLLQWKDGILSHYYHEETLKSDLARTVFVLPDKCLTAPDKR